MKMKVKIDGLRELDKNLAQFKKATQRNILERTLKKAAEPIKKDAQNWAPFDTGELKSSIGVRINRSSAGKTAFAQAMTEGASRTEAAAAARAANKADAGKSLSATVQVGTALYRAHFAEFGTIKQPAQPFLGPAFRANQDKVSGIIKEELGREIEKTAKRLAKRNAKKG
ncbi:MULTISPECIES: HK97-gp10 family putative phage morphogenesis protein [unclassified Xanthobacter]|uniref:HK97-gp10 family putative phage morphogenesis protein n=1 Tax=unclassified Xanthobacter TaxID=2623496 RepID=UPI001F1F7CC4|nr:MULTISPECIES: HK97-gp10 family putative phage morphogenesis protein [unclassified Xanthobacter]